MLLAVHFGTFASSNKSGARAWAQIRLNRAHPDNFFKFILKCSTVIQNF